MRELGIVTEVRAVQPEKAEPPMLVTLLEMVTEVRPLQPLKADCPMLVTLLGIVTEVKPLQPEKAESPILVTLLGIVELLQPRIRVFVAVSIIALQLLRQSYLLLPLATVIEVRPQQPLKA
mgnify:CR=1 FL=1